MGVVTKIESTKSKKGRKNIYIDEMYVGTLSDFCVFKYKIAEGGELTSQELCDIQMESDVDVVFSKMVQLLTVSRKTKRQVLDYLTQKGYVDIVVDTVVSKLEKYGYIDDKVFAKMYIENHKNNWGKRKIEYELRQKGVSVAIVDEVLAEIDIQSDTVYYLAQKYMSNKDKTRENYSKLMRYLMGKGYMMDDVMVAINKIKSEDNYEDW